jgi:hypothetical protein
LCFSPLPACFSFSPAADNNIAWWYYQVALSIALHAGDSFRANLLAQQLPNLVSKQISSDGVLFNEVKYAETACQCSCV